MKFRSNNMAGGRNIMAYTNRHYFGIEWGRWYIRVYNWTEQGVLPKYKEVRL